jgi:hypothetical protein
MLRDRISLDAKILSGSAERLFSLADHLHDNRRCRRHADRQQDATYFPPLTTIQSVSQKQTDSGA